MEIDQRVEYRVVKELLLQSLGEERLEEERVCSDTIFLEAPMQQQQQQKWEKWNETESMGSREKALTKK
ncbi:hypothetical protein SAY87_012207 [Trapa incisa]|uniref:Uncharacterized protein n=1 Tax=Trapa incisa TaxID=236973 RepID=A0AAN7GGW7_9MYRT|nr:hypothetical protein SAY87_012207 [Trapa incisa]